jgi:hypothetical protein
MAQQGYVFDERSARLIAEMVKRELKRPQSGVTRNTQRPTAYKYSAFVELTSALAEGLGETATALRLRREDEANTFATTEGDTDELTVVNIFEGVSGAIGTRLRVENYFGLWVVTPGVSSARWFKAALSAALESADSSASIDGLAALDGGSVPDISSASNWLNLAGADNANAAIVEDLSGESPAYLLMNVAHVAIEVVTDVADDTTELTKTTRTIVTMSGADDTDSATIATIDDCEEEE